MRKLISTGSPFEKTAGYSRAVVEGDWCFVAGTTGYDYATMTMPDSVEEQTPQLPRDHRQGARGRRLCLRRCRAGALLHH